MKKLWENIKANKLRSALIGCCAFLFGFISVSIFNSIGDTFAVSDAVCPSGWSLLTSGDSCCPAGNGWQYSYQEKKCSNSTLSKTECLNYANFNGYSNSNGKCEVSARYASRTLTGIFMGNGGKVNNITVFAGGDTSSGYLTCTTEIDSSTCLLSREPSATWQMHAFHGWGTTKDCKWGNRITSLSVDKTYYACWSENSACYVCGSAGKGSYKYGKFANASQCALYSTSLSETECLAKNTTTNKPIDPEEGSDTSTGNSTNNGTTDTGTTYVVASVKNYYAITYDLDEGHFIDGSRKRTEYMTGNNALGNMKTNPIKEGHVFIEWQYNGNAFDFSKPLDELGLKYENQEDKYIDITLKAVWEEHTDETLYCEDENAELDYATNKCYTVLKEDTSKEIYTHTTYSYEYVAGSQNVRFCYSYDPHNGDETPGGVYWRKSDNDITNNIVMQSSGKQGKTDGDYADYEGNDYWISSETCRIAAPCYVTTQSTDYPAESCELTYSAILYHEEDALEYEYEIPTEEPDTPSDGDEGTPNDGVGGGSDEEPSNDKTDKEANESPKTGDALIILAWIVGLCALGYTAYYFIKRNREN